jgi:hypothetical protein
VALRISELATSIALWRAHIVARYELTAARAVSAKQTFKPSRAATPLMARELAFMSCNLVKLAGRQLA